MKKNRKRAVSIALSLVLAMTAVNITGCGKKADSTNGELNLFIWTEYVPDEVIKGFEKEYGIKVTEPASWSARKTPSSWFTR